MVADQENIEANDDETPNKVKKVELEIQSDKDDSSIGTNSEVGMYRFLSSFIKQLDIFNINCS